MISDSDYVRLSLDNNKQAIVVDSNFLSEIRMFLSAENKAARFSGFGADSRIFAITPTGRALIGLFHEILKVIKVIRPNLTPQIEPEVMDAVKPSLLPEIYPLPNNAYGLRDYQLTAVQRSLQFGRGIILQPTGSGKTPTIGTLAYTIWKQNNCQGFVLILVPDRGLAGKTYEDFLNFGITNVTRWYDKYTPDTRQNFIITSHKILYVNPDRSIPIIKNALAVICDEVHTINRGCKINKILASCSTYRKFGFTGTLPDAVENTWNAIGMTGPVIAQDEAVDLTKRGFIADVKVKILRIKYKDQPPTGKGSYIDDYLAEADFLYSHPYRNEVIKQIVAKIPKNCLILVERKSHGVDLAEIIKETGKQVFFVQGSVEVDERAEIIKVMEQNDDVVCIAMTQIFRQGISIDNIHYLMLAALGKARSRLIQSIGRGRRKPSIKNNLVVFDIVDELKYSSKHSMQRYKIYKQEKFDTEVTRIQEP